MSIQFGDILKHNNLLYPIVDINDVKGGLRSIATFSSLALVSEYASIPEKYRSGYSLLLETSTSTIYYLAGNDATNEFHWSPVGIGGNGFGVTNSIPKWISSSILGNSNITDNGDTITISGNLMVIGTTSTISTENLLVKDPIILLAGSQSGTPTYDAGLFVNRGTAVTKAFIWDESGKEFKFISTTSLATTSGNVSIDDYESVRTGVLRVGTQSINSNDRFVVSSSTGSVSLVVDNNGNVYNSGKGNISTNTVFGYSSLLSNTTGFQNTSIGHGSLYSNVVGNDNVSIGYSSLYFNTSGYSNTSVGSLTLQSNTSGNHNVAIGYESLQLNSTGSNNTSIGSFTSQLNTTGSWNTTLGYVSSGNNKTGNSNVTIGYGALYSATQSSFNTAVGNATLWVSQGSYNTTLGYNSLGQIITGNYNIGIGVNAGTLMSGTTSHATQSDNSIFIGYDTRPQTSLQTNQIVIGHSATGNGSNSVTLGNDNITKTILKGNVGIGLTGPNCALEINGHKTYTLPDTEGASGEIVFFGTASTALDAGYIYQFTTTGVWEKADFTTESTAKGLLAISLGTSVSDGLLIKGYAKFDYSPYGTMTLGSTLYLWENGVFNSTPATNPGEVVRVIGYCIDEPPLSAGTLYFCPDTTWIELS